MNKIIRLDQLINEHGIYNDYSLRSYLSELEKYYNIVEEIDKFKNLVNFSTNNNKNFHNWFNYREGFSGILVDELLRRYPLDEKQYVLDPFSGSGTTMVASSLKGIPSLGIDINPMSVDLANAKLINYSFEDISEIVNLIQKLNLIELAAVDISNYQDIAKYFERQKLEDLLGIKEFVCSIENENVRDLFWAGYLSMIIEASDRKRDGNGLKTSYSKIVNLKNDFIFKIECMLADITNAQKIEKASAKAFFGSAREGRTVLHKKYPIGSIIFSPPYPNSFDYFESYKLELRLGDYVKNLNRNAMKEYREKAVTSFISSPQLRQSPELKMVDRLASEIESAIPEKEQRTGKKDSRTRKVPNMIRGYFSDMKDVLEECFALLDLGGTCSIVVDQSVYLGKIVPTDLLLANIGESLGFRIEKIVICREAKTSGQQYQLFPYLKGALRESIVILKKD
ncbi:DNA methyltransferase [Enterococcus hirae]|uniref:DNA methyltransferase n=1 Tax=Enterococcus hirae TaxID=1354 RepID=UPI000CE81EC6|nr:DNA methyltransferase [Enterococcus hirae]PPE97820.1 hypothetical protein C4611_12225 [Enterococcus hirae]PPF00185.1 hypothetical protein C4610_12225 [Enterococcus hirae]